MIRVVWCKERIRRVLVQKPRNRSHLHLPASLGKSCTGLDSGRVMLQRKRGERTDRSGALLDVRVRETE